MDARAQYLTYLLHVNLKGYATVNFIEGYDPNTADLSSVGISTQEFSTLVDNTRNIADYNALFVAVYNFLMVINGKKRWLDKLPGYVSQVPEMAMAVPTALFIELVRDPRDILASKKSRLARGGGYDPIWDTLAWRASIRAGDAANRAIFWKGAAGSL